MKGKFFFLALSAMALATGCSNDEMTEVNRGDGIDFSVTAGKLTRAAATTTSSISEFKVWAFTDGKTYMDGTSVNKGNDNKWTYTGTKFWPETSVDFFAVSPATPQSGTVSVTNEGKTITAYTANGNEDLLYAANFSETKDKHATSPVAVNFRHALSQIVFKVKKTATSSINVKVKGIKVDGVANMSTLTWATATTGANLPEGNADTETGNSWGTWATPTGNTEYTAVDLADASEVEVTTIASFLTSDAGNGALFLMPQTLEPWLTLSDNGEATITGSARLLVNCQITDELSGIQLWPKNEGEFAEVAISLSNPTNDPNKKDGDTSHDRWMQGKKYIYTLIFGEGGGYKPDPDPEDPEDPTPVLVPITFTVTVDEFQDGGEYNLNVNNPE